ncbi:MAG: T9SS type A sorting domain-containing protein, partial [Aureispira sp.]
IHDKGDVAVEAGQLTYSLIDPTPNLGINYYRLQSTALDGSIRYSEWKTVTFQNSMLVNLFPNPTSGNLFLQLHSEQRSDLSWQIINSVGQVVLEGDQSLQTGIQTFELPTTPLTSGFYSIRISHAATGFVQQHNFIKD